MYKNQRHACLRTLSRLGLVCAVCMSLQACVGLLVGGAVMGTVAATDRRTLGAQTEDKTIAVKGEVRLSNALGEEAHVNVNAYNRRVLLTGEVHSAEARATAERELAAIEGVLGVTNEIQVVGASNFSARSNDVLLTTKVKASFIDNAALSASAFKVVSEAGVVYLMGRVTQREGDQAADVASRVSGVRKVVKMFEYISEDELKEMQIQPGKSG